MSLGPTATSVCVLVAAACSAVTMTHLLWGWF